MAGRYSLTVVRDIALNSTVENLLEGLPGRVVAEDSQILVYATRETVDVFAGVTVGREVALPNGSPTNINTVAGSLPSRQNDLLLQTGAIAGEEIIIQGVNRDVAAARELRILIDVIPIEDLPLQVAT